MKSHPRRLSALFVALCIAATGLAAQETGVGAGRTVSFGAHGLIERDERS